jgi:hypothetical protein
MNNRDYLYEDFIPGLALYRDIKIVCTGFASMGSPGFALKGGSKRDEDVPEIKHKFF